MWYFVVARYSAVVKLASFQNQACLVRLFEPVGGAKPNPPVYSRNMMIDPIPRQPLDQDLGSPGLVVLWPKWDETGLAGAVEALWLGNALRPGR